MSRNPLHLNAESNPSRETQRITYSNSVKNDNYKPAVNAINEGAVDQKRKNNFQRQTS